MNRIGKVLRDIRNTSYVQYRTAVTNPELPEEGGIKYHGFTYYPRRPDFKDPPYEPCKLFLVTRLCKMSGLHPVERNALEKLNIDGEVSRHGHVNIVKNIPEQNALLWKVKHLVKIKPIKFVNGLPKDGTFKGTYLRDNGTFMVTPNLNFNSESVKALEEYLNSRSLISNAHMMEYLRRRWEDAFTADM